MKLPRALVLTLGPRLGTWGLRLLAGTLRVRRHEAPVAALWAAGTPAIYAVWHARLLLLPYLYRGRRLQVLASRSPDGELVARLVERLGLLTVRGSSSRGGADALRRLARALREGWDVVVVPDGPRGPREVVKPGIITLAALTGVPIVPIAVGASGEWRTRSWDRFRIPKPFSTCVVAFGEPLQVAPRDRGAQVQARRDLEVALTELAARVDREAAA